MIAIDSSSLIAYLGGEKGTDVDLVDDALAGSIAVLPPAVLAELLSVPGMDRRTRDLLEQLPLLELSEGFWSRVGALRAKVLQRKRKARLADALIAQSCLDHAVPLVARDRDFRNFAAAAQLRILP